MLHFLCFDCIMCKRRGDLETASLAAAPAAPYAGALAARAQGAGFRLPMWGAAPPPALVARPWLRAFCEGPAASSATSVVLVPTATLPLRLRRRAGVCPALDDDAEFALRVLKPQSVGM